ncbi:MAG: hypothetical protein NT172_16830, partial [Planctomycetota bacterium]|nr:hypothetical protein [Planctomycetota bacterium]
MQIPSSLKRLAIVDLLQRFWWNLSALTTHNLVIRRLEKQWLILAHSPLGQRLGFDRIHPANLPAAFVSLFVHVVVVAVLMFATFAISEPQKDVRLDARVIVETALPEMERLKLEQLGQVADPTSKPAETGSFAPQVLTAIVESSER